MWFRETEPARSDAMLLQAQPGKIGQPFPGAEWLSRTSIGVAARALSSLAMILTSCTAAQAAEAKHLAKPEVVIWKSQDAQTQASELIAAGIMQSDPDAVLRLVACVVPNGTELTVISSGDLTKDVKVTSGKFAGCTGNVKKEFVVE
jgi:hypothetical protein